MSFALSRTVLSGGLCVLLWVVGVLIPPGRAASVQTDFGYLVRDVGLATSVVSFDLRGPAPAPPWSVGVSGSAVEVPGRNYVDRLYGNEDPPDYVYVPRVHLTRRWGRSVRGSAFLSQDPENDLRVVGGTLGGSFRPPGRPRPRVAVRAVGTRTSAQRDYVIQGVTVEDFRVETYGADGIIAYSMGRLIPYAGYGVLVIQGDAAARSGAVTLREVTDTEGRAFVGVTAAVSSGRLNLQVDAGSVRMVTAGLTVPF